MKQRVSNLIPESEGHNFASSAIHESVADMNLPRFIEPKNPEILFTQVKEMEN